MSRNTSGGGSEQFLTGKGFYIVLFLCAAVIGVSALMIATGKGTMDEAEDKLTVSTEKHTVSAVTVPASAEDPADTAEDTEPAVAEEPAMPVEAAAPVYIWPVLGEISRGYSVTALAYDETLRDWRTHCGVDISAGEGTPVTAMRAGTVESVVHDDMLGTVLTVSHGDGVRTVYANLDEATVAAVGAWVNSGDVIGTVGTSALGEIGQASHLHLAVTVNGEYADPMNYLPC